MSNSSLVKYTKISPNKTSPRNHSIDTITIHCMAGQLTVESCGNLFSKSSAKASSNYGIGADGRIALYVDEKDRSWATSNATNDHRAITIECASDSSSPYSVNSRVYDSLINLLVDICKRNNIKKLVWSNNKTDRVNHRNGCNMTVHRDYANKACPGDYLYGKMGEIAKTVNEKLGQSDIVAGWHKDSVGWWYVNPDGSYPKGCWKTIEGFDYYFKADGYMASDEYIKSDNYNKDGKLWYVDAKGRWDKLTYKWQSNNKGWWIQGIESGWYPQKEWAKIQNLWYYFDKNGYMVTGTVKIGLKTYKFNSDGALIS